MKYKQTGVVYGSDIYLNPPSDFARAHLYYVEMGGRAFLTPELYLQRPYFDMYEAFYIKRGRMAFHCLGRTYEAGPNSIVLLDCKCTPHYFRALTEGEELWFHFNGAASAAYMDMIGESGGFVFSAAAYPNAVNAIESIVRELDGDTRNEHRLSVWVATVLAELLSGQAYQLQNYDALSVQAIDYLQAHYQQEISMSDLARRLHLTPSYFGRMFKKNTGRAPYEMLLKIRIEKAQQLLLTTHEPLEEIAAQCGFSSYSSFARTFKKLTQRTPKQFRDTPY